MWWEGDHRQKEKQEKPSNWKGVELWGQQSMKPRLFIMGVLVVFGNTNLKLGPKCDTPNLIVLLIYVLIVSIQVAKINLLKVWWNNGLLFLKNELKSHTSINF